MAAGFKSHLTYYPAQLWQNTKKPFIFSAWSKENCPQYMQVCVCAEYKTVLESTVIMKIHEADYRVKVWLQALEDGNVVVTKVRTLPKVHIRDGWPLLKSSNLVLPFANQCCHDVTSCGSRVISHMTFTADTYSHIPQASNCHWNEWKCIADTFSALWISVTHEACVA